MNGEIPSVPITTLAGIASLTDLLPEMPLPSPLPQTLSNKSLLFHPRVAEEAQILLSIRDDALVPQLIQSLVQTSADHIELKDHYTGTEPPVDQQQNIPVLLKAILQRNPSVFKGPKANSPRQGQWNPMPTVSNSNHKQASPASYGQASPSSYPSPCGSRHTPQGSPAPPAPARLPQARLSVITDPPLKQNGSEASNGAMPVFNARQETGVLSANCTLSLEQEDLCSTSDLAAVINDDSASSNRQRTLTVPKPNQLVPDNILARTELADTELQLLASIPSSHTVDGPASAQPTVSLSTRDMDRKIFAVPDTRLKEPVVMLDRLSLEDQALMQKSLKAFAAKSPSLASQLGITSNHRKTRNAEPLEDSASDTDEDQLAPRNKSRYFKAREKERDVQRVKQKEERKKINYDDDEYVPGNSSGYGSSLSERIKKRKRSFPNHRSDDNIDNCASVEDTASSVPKPKLRKVERKFLPVLEKLSTEDLMETNTYQRFTRSIELVFENTEDLDLTADLDDDADAPPEAMIPKYQLQDLCSEAAKLKTLGAMDSVPSDRLVRLLNILEKNIRDGTRVSPLADPDDDEDESKRWLELTMERVMRAVDASLTAVYIMTSSNMPKRIYLEDVIDRIVLFTKYQLQNTIYPSFDPVYRIDSKSKDNYTGNARKKRANVKEVREKSILTLYNKLHALVSLLAELLSIQVLTDTAVLQASSMGVAPFFVENVSELQLSSLKLVTTIFTKYEKHRRLLLDDILASIARLPSSKRSLRSYRLSSEENIQMLTALVLQLIQCVVVLPDSMCSSATPNKKVKEEGKEEGKDEKGSGSNINIDRDVLIVSKYETATRTAGNFLTVFLNKCGNKSDDIDYRPLFENFVQDLLTTVNKPEWPATELLLSLLGKLLVTNFGNKGVEMSLRVTSLDNLGLVAARLRKDAVTSQGKLNTIDQIIRDVKAEELKDGEELKKRTGKTNTEHKSSSSEPELDDEEERTQFLQRVLLDYLAVNSISDQAHTYARHFYLAQWYRDATVDRGASSNSSKRTTKHVRRNKKPSRKKRKDESSDEQSSGISDLEDDEDILQSNQVKNAELLKLTEQRKAFLIRKIKPIDDSVVNPTHTLQTYIDCESAELIARYLASKRSFSRSFDVYLKQILCVLTEPSIQIRTKALKCLTMVVEADSSILARLDMQTGVRHSFLDHSTSVREAAVDLVGKFVLSRPELIDKYYDMLSARILDTGVSVRKRVIKILKDICIECPEFTKIPEICVKMIRRVNDEEGIRKLVMEVFQNMWFTPVRDRPSLDAKNLLRKVMNITDVVAASKEMGLDWFEQLLISLFKPKEDKDDSTKVQVEPPKTLLTACKQIVDCLIENVLRLEETSFHPEEESRGSSQRLVACLTTLYLFAKIRPQLLVDHAITLQPYLSLKCQTQGDYQIISSVARTLELVVPLMEHPSETFLAQLEEDSVKLIFQHNMTVVASCLSCLGSVVNNVTRNFKLIRDCFQKYYGHLTSYKTMYVNSSSNPLLIKYRPHFRRAMFTVGLLLRHFDFTDKDVIVGLPEGIKNEVFETLSFFVHQELPDIQTFTLKAIGSLCIRHYDFMLGSELKTLYHRLLTEDDAPLQMRMQVLNNIEMYLQEEERRMIKQDQEWSKLSKGENLKEMGDVSSGMASTVIQLYLKEILDAFLHCNIGVRHAALKVIQLILQQGLVHIVQIVPYLICMSTDGEQVISHSADKQLQDIEKKYPGFIHMKSQSGILLAYKLQLILQSESSGIARGFRIREGEAPGALNGFLYSILRSTKQQRRALALSVLKQFDEQVKTSLSQMLYLADNLAYFPYQVQDEPLFIIHHIDIMISVSGTNLLQSFKEALMPSTSEPKVNLTLAAAEAAAYLEEDEDEDESVLLSRVPVETDVLQDCITASQGCLLLLVLKQHLKDLYGISDAKINQYSPSETAKVYEKAVSRKSNSRFDPKATLQKLKQGAPPSILDEAARKALIAEYLDFKQLMLKFDPEDPDDEDRETAAAKAITVSIKTSEDGANNSVDAAPPPQVLPLAEHREPPQKIPKVTIVPPKPPEVKDSKHHKSHKAHKAERHKKHRHKKKRKRFGDDEDSDAEFSDPDFLV